MFLLTKLLIDFLIIWSQTNQIYFMWLLKILQSSWVLGVLLVLTQKESLQAIVDIRVSALRIMHFKILSIFYLPQPAFVINTVVSIQLSSLQRLNVSYRVLEILLLNN